MTRARLVFAATAMATSMAAAGALAQSSQTSPPMQSVLAGKKFTPPIKGTAEVEYVTTYGPKVEKNMVVTEIKVKNMSNAPIPRLTIAETWYDAKQNIVTGGKGQINGLLQPGEIGTVRVESPYNKDSKQNMLNFSHANGDIKPKKVKAFTGEAGQKEPATKTAAAKKK